MKISEYDGSKLRLILIGMITDAKVCSRISTIMSKPKGPRFDQKWADLIAKWCREHLDKYQAPPNGNIEVIFRKWADSTKADPQTITQIETLLDYMSEEYTGGAADNSDFILDLASEHFNKHRLKSVVEEVEDRISYGEIDDAYNHLGATSRIELGYSNMISPLKDVDIWLESVNEDRPKPLFEYPGAIGELIGSSFTRGTLFAFQGVDKVGKSFYLLDAAWRALKKRKKVLLFEVGDLGKEEILIRLAQRINQEPEFSESVRWPTGWTTKNPEMPTYSYVSKNGMSVAHAARLLKKVTRGKDLLRISPHPNSSINVAGIETVIQDLARSECWLPDCTIIDYADILAPPEGRMEINEQIDQTWKQLRRMSQRFNCLVLTATQSGAQAYRSKSSVLTRKDFQGRRTKFAEVNGMLGLNANDHDIQNGVTRLNWIVRRKGKWSVNRQVLVAGCLATASPIVISKWAEYAKKSENTKDEDDSEDINDEDE